MLHDLPDRFRSVFDGLSERALGEHRSLDMIYSMLKSCWHLAVPVLSPAVARYVRGGFGTAGFPILVD